MRKDAVGAGLAYPGRYGNDGEGGRGLFQGRKGNDWVGLA
jgi:hypothetical protein